MPLFDEIERTYAGPARYSQPKFDYLNRSARRQVEAIRNVMEQWFAEYPARDQPDLRGRIRSPDNRQHIAAFFELYVYVLFRRLEFGVERHTSTVGRMTRPDFKLMRAADAAFLEATLAAPSDREVAAANRENRVYDVLDQMDSPNFFVGLEVVGEPQTDLPAARMRAFLTRELGKLDPDGVAAAFDRGGQQAVPRWRFKHGEWEVEFSPIPKSPEARGKPGVRPLGYRMFGPEYVNSWEGIVGALRSKATRYGELDLPYVVAVNVIDDFADDVDIVEALFGQEEVLIRGAVGQGFQTEYRRRPNGLWAGPTGPVHTGVSAILAVENFTYWDIARTAPVLWHNPWARMPLPEGFWVFSQRVADLGMGRLRETGSSRTLHDVFGLAQGWPLE